MGLKLDNELMENLSMVLGRPSEDQAWEELKGINQQAISMSMDARNSHLLMTKLELEGDTRGLA